MKQVLFIDETAEMGGAEVNLLMIAGKLQALGWTPLVVLPGDGPLTTALSGRGIPFTRIPRPPLLSTSFYLGRRKVPNLAALLVNGILGLVWVLRLYRYLAASSPAVVHTVSMWTHAFAGLAARLAGRPVVWHFQDIVDAQSGLGLYRRLVHLWARHIPDRIICISQKVAEQFADDAVIAPKLTLLWNVVDVERFVPAGPGQGFESATRPLTIATVARLTPWKGQEVALGAAHILKERGVPFRWLFVGEEALGVAGYGAYLRDLVRSRQLEQHVQFVGWVDDTPSFYTQVDILAHLPVEPEPFGLVLAEAMAAGLVVVTSAGGGADRLVEAARGILVQPGCAEHVADVLAELVANPRAIPEWRRAARSFAEQTYRVEDYMAQLVALYAALLRKHTYAS